MRIRLVITAVTEDNSRECDFIGGNIQVGTDLIRVLYIFVGDTIVSTPQDARQHQQMRKQANMKTRRPPKHARKVYKKTGPSHPAGCLSRFAYERNARLCRYTSSSYLAYFSAYAE